MHCKITLVNLLQTTPVNGYVLSTKTTHIFQSNGYRLNQLLS